MSTSSRAVGIAALAAVAAGMMLVYIRESGTESAAGKELRSAAARSERRALSGRLIGFDYAPRAKVSRGATLAEIQVKAAASRVLASANTGLEAAHAHALIGELDAEIGRAHV